MPRFLYFPAEVLMGVIIDSLADRVRMVDARFPVPGLLFLVTAEKLKQHCEDRAAYHAKRAEEKQSEIPALQQTADSLQESIDKIKGFTRDAAAVPAFSGKGTVSNSYGFDGGNQVAQLEAQIRALRDDIRNHANKAASFKFLADSLFPTDYALEWEDLSRLELVR